MSRCGHAVSRCGHCGQTMPEDKVFRVGEGRLRCEACWTRHALR